MNRRRLAVIGSITILFLIGIVGVVTLWSGNGTEAPDIDDYADRELMLPDDSYTLPSVEEQVLQPQFNWYIDPDEPLRRDITEGALIDLPDVLQQTFQARVERRLEELLFDE